MAKHPACRYPDRPSRDLPIPSLGGNSPEKQASGHVAKRDIAARTEHRHSDRKPAPVTTGKRSPKRALSRRENVETQTESETSFRQEQTAGTGKIASVSYNLPARTKRTDIPESAACPPPGEPDETVLPERNPKRGKQRPSTQAAIMNTPRLSRNEKNGIFQRADDRYLA
ncbi:hypothetical protein NB636_04905 [Oxalobacter aliiformigenes]|uniref:hypothetical protein n=1 Tax=Oxalobacter aliiformigenes TaxID=2946593 RepID=UPI0022AEC04B|nr:hypothetical protein [Oxalobacter aliiformigenes]MCZ4064913.1 hypothetical protein [Oxalobacter aliiformigenes]WAW00187.1 hypothetical protein NB636_04905 [Oxalobacter aliiformigenes]